MIMKVPISMPPIRRLFLGPLVVAFSLCSPLASAQEPKVKWGDKPGTEGTFDLWQNEAKVKKGAERLARIYQAAGGLEAWGNVKGVRFDMLETWRVEVNKDTREFRVHHRTPRLAWFEPDGDGFVRSEYVMPDGITPNYRREISVGNYSWAESKKEFIRKPGLATRARSRITRLFLLGCLPFSLQELGGEMAFLKLIDGGEKAMYGVRLSKPVVMHTLEEQTQFIAIVDLATNKIVQLQYSLYDRDKLTLDESTECAIDFEGEIEFAGVKIPNKHYWSYETGGNIQEYWIEDVINEAPPAKGMQRPWQSGSLFQTQMRADHWDPPVKPGDAKEVDEEGVAPESDS